MSSLSLLVLLSKLKFFDIFSLPFMVASLIESLETPALGLKKASSTTHDNGSNQLHTFTFTASVCGCT